MRIRSLILAPVAVLGVLVGAMAFASVPAQAARTAIGAFGPEGPGSGPFAGPESIAVDQTTGDVYVYEIGEDEAEEVGNIYKFNAAGTPEEFSYLETNVIEGIGGEEHRVQIAVNSSSGPDEGDIYVATGEEVLIYSSAGEELGKLDEGADELCGVAVDPTSGDVYVSDKEEEKISKYVPTGSEADYTYESSLWEVQGNACNIAADSVGDIYLANYNAGGVTKYEASQFETEEEWEEGGEESASGEPVDNGKGATLAVDPSGGDVYIDEKSDIAEYSSEGVRGEVFGSLSDSYGVAVSDASGYKGHVYASGGEESEVMIFGPASVAEDLLTINPAGGGSGTVACEIKDSGIPEDPCASKYPAGTELVLRARASMVSEFTGFSDGTGSAEDCTTSPCEFTIEEDSSVTATFPLISTPTPKDELTIDRIGTGEVKCKVNAGGSFGTCATEYDEGTEITLKGIEGSGFTFEGWSAGAGSAEDCASVGTGNCTFILEAESSVTATFGSASLTEYTLTVAKLGEGTVTSTPSGIDCGVGAACSHVFLYGEKVELKEETTVTDYEFLGWIGCESAGTTCMVEGTRETEVTAVFIKTAEKGTEGKAGKEGKKGEQGEQGEPGINGTNGGRGLQGPVGEVGPAGAQGETGPAGANGKDGAQGPAGPAGAAGPAGPAGEVELVTCRTAKRKGKSVQACTTKLVSGTVELTATGASVHAMLSRHGAVYAAGTARSTAHGRTRLRLEPLRRLRPGHYTLTLISGTGSRERIHDESFTLR